MTSIFKSTGQKIKNEKVVLWLFVAALTMLIFGLYHFYEDMLSSRYGLQMLEQAYGLVPATHEVTYWTISFSPQIVQIVFAYMLLSKPKKTTMTHVAIFLGLVFVFALDFLTDVWYRTNGEVFNDPKIFIAGGILTLLVFTIGSEVFITVGVGITLELLTPAKVQFTKLIDEFFSASHKKRGRPPGIPTGKPRAKAPTATQRKSNIALTDFLEGGPYSE